MKNITDDLIKEHDTITEMHNVMSRIAQKLQKDEPVETEHLARIVEFLKLYSKEYHQGQEENVLFPLLSQDKTYQKMVNVLIGEHHSGRDLVRGIDEHLTMAVPGNPHSAHIATNLLEIVRLTSEHFNKENNFVFPLANKILPAETSENLEKYEEKVLDDAKRQEFHRWLEELKKTYFV